MHRLFATTLFAALFQAFFSLPSPAAAQEQRFIGQFRDWVLYTYVDDGDKLCFITSEPTDQDGNYTRRGPPAPLVTRLPGDPPTVEVSYQPGYSYLADSDVTMRIDDNSYTLFTQGEHAWANNGDDDGIVAAMKAGQRMTVRGTSTKETWSEDSYSLLGFTRAYNAMVEACAG